MNSFKKALAWTLFWVASALIFNIGVYFCYGSEKAFEFLAGYLLEESLSIDNLFVFLLIFSYFKISPNNQHRVLFWGILCALIFRAIFILGGVFFISQFHWLLYFFGALLVFTSIKILFYDEDDKDLKDNYILRGLKRFLPIADDYVGKDFLIRQNGKLLFTPLFVVLLMVEISDIVFAADSLPAIFAITLDPFVIYTSNIFAILGLRSLYFVLAEMMVLFQYLKYGVATVLMFIGAKILLKGVLDISVIVTLCFIILALGASIFYSVFKNGYRVKKLDA